MTILRECFSFSSIIPNILSLAKKQNWLRNYLCVSFYLLHISLKVLNYHLSSSLLSTRHHLTALYTLYRPEDVVHRWGKKNSELHLMTENAYAVICICHNYAIKISPSY